VRANTIEALEHIKAQEAIPALFTALRDPDNRIRAAAAKALQSFGEEKVFGELKKMLESPEEWMKVSAIYALSHITAPESIEMLIETVKTAQQPETKIKAIIALANYYDQSTYVFLRGLEANSDGIIKETAAKAIKLIEEKFGPNPPETTILNLQDDDAQNEKAQNQGAGGEKTDDLATTVSNFFRKGKDEAIELSNRTALNFR
jgi:HEAT repeat protein